MSKEKRDILQLKKVFLDHIIEFEKIIPWIRFTERSTFVSQLSGTLSQGFGATVLFLNWVYINIFENAESPRFSVYQALIAALAGSCFVSFANVTRQNVLKFSFRKISRLQTLLRVTAEPGISTAGAIKQRLEWAKRLKPELSDRELLDIVLRIAFNIELKPFFHQLQEMVSVLPVQGSTNQILVKPTREFPKLPPVLEATCEPYSNETLKTTFCRIAAAVIMVESVRTGYVGLGSAGSLLIFIWDSISLCGTLQQESWNSKLQKACRMHREEADRCQTIIDVFERVELIANAQSV